MLWERPLVGSLPRLAWQRERGIKRALERGEGGSLWASVGGGEGNEWTGGPAHKHYKDRTFLARRWDRVRVGADAAASMLSYELGASREGCAEKLPGCSRFLRLFDFAERW